MQDDRFARDPDDEANANDRRAAYIDRTPRASAVRPAAKQPDHRGPPTPEEIEAFVAKEFGSPKEQQKKRLLRPEGWDGPEDTEEKKTEQERGDAWEGEE